MRFVTLAFSSHRELVAHFADKPGTWALFCPTKAQAIEGEKVIVDINLPRLRKPARLLGQVLSCKDTGLWIEFTGQSRSTAAYLRSLRDGAEFSRAHVRYPASLAVRCEINEENPESAAFFGEITDLSRGGAFVYSPQNPMIGTRVTLHIGPPQSALYRIDGRVVWLGMLDNLSGFGVRFDKHDPSAATLRTRLRHARETGLLDL